MINELLAREVIEILGLTNASIDVQQQALERVESVAIMHASRALPDMLNKEQARRVEMLPKDDVQAWLIANVKGYRTMLREVTLHIAEGMADS